MTRKIQTRNKQTKKTKLKSPIWINLEINQKELNQRIDGKKKKKSVELGDGHILLS